MRNAIRKADGVSVRFHVTPESEVRAPRILCATDFSPRSEHAVKRAGMLAMQLEGELLLLHVVDERQAMNMIGRRADRARSVLQQQVRHLAHLDASTSEISVRVGKPHQTIAQVAKEWDADLVVLGAYRARTADRFLGTTAERVVQAATRPVLIVNHEPTQDYGSVLLASDLSEGFARIARMTHDLGLLDGARASVVHAVGRDEAMVLASVGVSETEIGRYLRELRISSSNELLSQFEQAGLDASRFAVFPRHQTPFRAIEGAVERSAAELVVVGMTGYRALKRALGISVSNEVLRKIACDVLIASPETVLGKQRGSSLGYRKPDFAHAGMNPEASSASLR